MRSMSENLLDDQVVRDLPQARLASHRAEAPLVNQLVFQGVVSQIAVGSQAHFFHNARPVSAHGLHAQGK